MSAEIAAGITDELLGTGTLIDSARRDTCGAVVSFIGVVRNHNGGESMDTIEYPSHPSSQQILRDIVMELRDCSGVHHITVWHCVGYLEISENIMVVVIAAEHRAQTFHTAEAIVEDVRAKLSIWKKQELTNGSHNWSGL